MKKVILSSLVMLFSLVLVTPTYAQETAVVKSNQSAISKELKSNLEGNDPDKEILMKPGNSVSLPDWIKTLPNNKNNSLFGANAESTDSFVNQLLRMSENSYYDDKAIGSWAGSWQLYKKYTDPDTSFTVYVYRQKYIEETDTGMYGYTFAFRGTADKVDYIEDAGQVVGNIGGMQAQDAVDYVRNMIDSDRNLINHVYFTGHSLGGYLASWVQSEMVDGIIPMGQSYTLTFNAPGLSLNIFPTGAPFDVYKAKVASKMYNDKFGKYDGFIANYSIKNDAISAFGDSLGNVYTYNAISSGNLLYYHELERFWELDL